MPTKPPARAPQRNAAPPPRQQQGRPPQQATRPQVTQAQRPQPGQQVAERKAPAPAIVGAANLPAHLRNDAGKGMENLRSGDFEMPRIRLLQSTSEEVKDGRESAGNFWHHLAEQSLGTQIRLVPIFIDIRYILWRPLEDGGGILARADDGVHWSPPNGKWRVKIKNVGEVDWTITHPTVAGSGLDQWGSFNPKDPQSPPAATKMYNMVMVSPDHPDLTPAVITLQRSAIKVGQKLFGKMKLSPAPIYGQQFIMESVMDQGPSGDYFNYAFTADGYVEDEEVFNGYKAMHEAFARAGFSVRDLESAQRDESEVQTGNGGAPAEGSPSY